MSSAYQNIRLILPPRRPVPPGAESAPLPPAGGFINRFRTAAFLIVLWASLPLYAVWVLLFGEKSKDHDPREDFLRVWLDSHSLDGRVFFCSKGGEDDVSWDRVGSEPADRHVLEFTAQFDEPPVLVAVGKHGSLGRYRLSSDSTLVKICDEGIFEDEPSLSQALNRILYKLRESSLA